MPVGRNPRAEQYWVRTPFPLRGMDIEPIFEVVQPVVSGQSLPLFCLPPRVPGRISAAPELRSFDTA
jgi:hypothetical protein